MNSTQQATNDIRFIIKNNGEEIYNECVPVVRVEKKMLDFSDMFETDVVQIQKDFTCSRDWATKVFVGGQSEDALHEAIGLLSAKPPAGNPADIVLRLSAFLSNDIGHTAMRHLANRLEATRNKGLPVSGLSIVANASRNGKDWYFDIIGPDLSAPEAEPSKTTFRKWVGFENKGFFDPKSGGSLSIVH